MEFTQFGLKPEQLKALSAMGITTPTKVQQEALPVLMQGKDLVCRAKTGSGKTISFLLPILGKLQPKGLHVLILVPTRELVQQINKEIRKLDRVVRSLEVYGGVSISPQIERLHNAQIVVAT